jgi:SOS-response transcriptional repressor LexA
MHFMTRKQTDSSAKWPNGLAAALAKAKERNPGIELGPTTLARLTKENKQTIDRYIKGERKLPMPVAEKLAPLVHASVAELLLVESAAFERVPLLSWVEAGKLADQDGVSNVDVEKHIVAVDLPKGKWIALRVKGDSMDRLAPDGAIIFIDRTDDRLKEDQFYVFSVGAGAATFKRYRGGKSVRLQPYSNNPDHETIPAPDDLRVVGRVRRVVTDLR